MTSAALQPPLPPSIPTSSLNAPALVVVDDPLATDVVAGAVLLTGGVVVVLVEGAAVAFLCAGARLKESAIAIDWLRHDARRERDAVLTRRTDQPVIACRRRAWRRRARALRAWARWAAVVAGAGMRRRS